MGTLYLAIPRDTAAPFDLLTVATTTALKSVLQVGVPSTTDIRIHGWGVGFAGVAPTDPAGEVSLVDCAVASTGGTSLTPEKWESQMAQASLCVGGAALTAYNLTSPTETGVNFIGGEVVHPQTAYGIMYPEGRRPKVGISRFLKIRTTFSVSINCVPWILWEEPG